MYRVILLSDHLKGGGAMFRYKKIYCGFDVHEFSRIKDFLEKEGIENKIKIANPTQERLQRNVLFGGNPLIMNRVGTDTETAEYTIWVDKAKVEIVEAFLEGHCD